MSEHVELVKRAAWLCKADLMSNLVGEFPELQGIIGGHLALKDGEDPRVAKAIAEHYLPKFDGDELPETIGGISLSIADKLDHVVLMFAQGGKPAGQKDPYAVKRAAIGILNIIINKSLILDLKDLLHSLINLYKAQDIKINVNAEEIIDFFFERLRAMYKEKGINNNILLRRSWRTDLHRHCVFMKAKKK